MTFAHLNVNGWTRNNDELRREIINNLNCDLIGISKSHLVDNETIQIQNYTWMKKNRRNVNKASGGVGFFIKK